MRVRLTTRLGIGYFTVIALLVGVVAADLTASSLARRAYHRVERNILPSIDAADQLLIAVERMQTSELLMLARPREARRWEQDFDEAAASFEREFGRLGTTAATPAGREFLDSIGRQFGAYRQLDARLRRLMAAGRLDQAREENGCDSMAVATQLVDATRRFRSFELDLNRQVSADGDRVLRDAQDAGLALAGLAMLLALVIWWRTARDVVDPLADLAEATRLLGTGGRVRAVHPAAARTVELAGLQASFNQAADSLASLTQRLQEANAGLESQVEARTQDLQVALARQQDLVEELKSLDKLKSDFMSVASHELLTPINFISGFGSALEDGIYGPLSGSQQGPLHQMMEGADRLTRMVRNILVYSQLHARQLELVPEALDVQALATDVAVTAGDRVKVVGSDELPLAWADPSRLGMAIAELVDNALKFSPPGSQVELILTPGTGTVAVAIADQGPGVPDAARAHLFEPFYQADATSTRLHGGLGLGLAIAHGIVALSGGALRIDHGPQGGTVVGFELPAAPSRAP
jgi:signal transduction histidine kinase